MADMGSYVWFIGLGAGTVLLAIAVLVARGRKRPDYKGDENHAWKQAAAETGRPEVARPNAN